MKKALLTLMCMVAMIAAGTSLKAQEITITLTPGWNWISYTNAVSMGIGAALGDFTPVQGDIIKSKSNGTTTYNGTMWRGTLTQFMPGQGYKYFSARNEAITFVFAQAPSSYVTTTDPTDIHATSAVVGSIVTIEEGNHIYARGVCWDTMQMPTVDDNHTSDGTGTGTFTTALTGLTPSTTYYVRVYAVTDYGLVYGDEQSFITLDGSNSGDHDYVNLGLPSGTLWATCNMGADNPEDYGDYFAWGETQPKYNYNWNTYQHCNGSYNTLTKYCSNPSYGYNGFTDNLTTLLPEDDAATVNWGADWHMPTYYDWLELYQNTTMTWTTQNGVNGRLFTARNGNTLFLPAAGYRYLNNILYAGGNGYYGSSSLYTDLPNFTWYFYFYSDIYYLYYYYRDYGFSVRPVRSAFWN